jgi:hypothetical protein
MNSNVDSPVSSLPADVTWQAQAEAERFFGAGPIADWHAPATPAAPRRWPLWLAAASGLVVAALLVSLNGWASDDDAEPEWPATGDPADDLIDTPATTQPPKPSVAKTTAEPTLNITRHGREWRIEAIGVSRLEAAQRLAQASGSPLLGNTEPLAAARPLHLSWQGRGAANAWQAVLGPELSFAAQCGAMRCRVWLLGTSTSGPAPMPALHRPPTVTPMPEAVEVALAPPASESADPRIASHHD